MAELAQDKSLDFIIKNIAEGDGETSFNAGMEILNSASDRDLRTQMTKLVTEYQGAKNSVDMSEAFEDIIEYTKKQMALIIVQGFRFGQTYQSNIDKEIFEGILKKAKDFVDDSAANSPKDEKDS